MKPRTKGYLFALLAAFFFSFIAIIGKGLVGSGIHPIQLSFYQYCFTVLLLTGWIGLRNPIALRPRRKLLGLYALQGIVGSLGSNLLFYGALMYLDAGLTSMLLFVNPVYVTVFFALTGLRAMRPVNFISVILAVVGAMIVLNVFSGGIHAWPGLGLVWGIGSGLTYAFYNVLADLKFQSEDPNVINLFASVSALVVSAVLLAATGIGYAIPLESLPSILLLASISGILPIFFIFKALKFIGSEQVTVVASMELPMTLVLAFTLLGERMAPIQLVGIVCIVGATLLLHGSEEQEELEAQETHE